MEVKELVGKDYYDKIIGESNFKEILERKSDNVETFKTKIEFDKIFSLEALKKLSNIYDSIKNFEEYQIEDLKGRVANSISNQFLAHLNHPCHNFNSEVTKITTNDTVIISNRSFPFNLSFHTYCLFDTYKKPHFGIPYTKTIYNFKYVSVKGNVEYLNNNSNPNELISIFNYLNYETKVLS